MRAVILISGNGSNLQSLIDNAKKIDLEICLVISNKEDAFGLKRAKRANITAHFVDPNLYKSREDFDKQLITIIDKLNISLIVLAGTSDWAAASVEERATESSGVCVASCFRSMSLRNCASSSAGAPVVVPPSAPTGLL